ncbi:MAG: D-2-hydroxyacid dehydrogenase [Eubacterium sp.]|nr:D-2-hydroxyacid dehydrogenase [Eubacterium sp.]
MKIVFLDGKSVGDDIDLSGFRDLGEFVIYSESTPEEAAERSVDADILLVNKVPVCRETIGAADKLKLVCVTATGINNLDTEYLKSRGIPWRNAAGYSTESVAQHTFAMLFYLLEKLRYYDEYVKSGAYANSSCFTHIDAPFSELNGKTFGIIGLGTIGRRVASIARAFGMNVIYASASGRPAQEGYEQVSLEELYARADVVSVHAPLNEHTEHLINKEAFKAMKNTAIFLNLGRGPIVVDRDLREALDSGEIAAAGLDVLTREPMSKDHPLLGFKDSSRLIITPHIAWASKEARVRLMEIVRKQVEEFLS